MSAAPPEEPPDIVLVGHLARDERPGGDFALGGTVAYGALLAARLGARPGIVTTAPAEDVARLLTLEPLLRVVNEPSAIATIFANHYDQGQRQQRLRSRAPTLAPDVVPPAWRAAPVTLLGPIADEIPPALAATLRGAIRAATPQGWLRGWDARGMVQPIPWASADAILPTLTDLILSVEDVASAAGAADRDQTLAAWAARVAYVAVTDGPRGVALWRDGVGPTRVPAFPATEVDPTGAGDCFAVAWLVARWRGADPMTAARFAHAAASFVVRRPGLAGIPDAAMIAALLAGEPSPPAP